MYILYSFGPNNPLHSIHRAGGVVVYRSGNTGKRWAGPERSGLMIGERIFGVGVVGGASD